MTSQLNTQVPQMSARVERGAIAHMPSAMARRKRFSVEQDPPRIVVPAVAAPGKAFEMELELGLEEEPRSAVDVLLAGLSIRAVDHQEPMPLTAPELWCGECSSPVVVIRASNSSSFTVSRRAQQAQQHNSVRYLFDRCRVACVSPREHLGISRVVLVLAPMDVIGGHALVSRPVRIGASEKLNEPQVQWPWPSRSTLSSQGSNGSMALGVSLTRTGISKDLFELLIAFLRDSILCRIAGFTSLTKHELSPGIVVLFASCETPESLKHVQEATDRYWRNDFGFENCLCTDFQTSGLISCVRGFDNALR